MPASVEYEFDRGNAEGYCRILCSNPPKTGLLLWIRAIVGAMIKVQRLGW